MSAIRVNSKKLLRVIANSEGFSLTELLAAIFIMTLVSVCMASGVQFAVRQYHDSMVQSESKVLCSTLTTVIQEELGNTSTVTLGPDDTVKTFFNSKYGDSGFYSVAVDDNHVIKKLEPGQYGELFLGTEANDEGNLLVGSAAYSSYDLGARINSLTYDATNNVFHVSLGIGLRGEELFTNNFDVKPINIITVTT